MSEKSTKKGMFGGPVIFFIAMVAVFILGMLLMSILERRGESRLQSVLVPMDEWETDNAEWGKNYPRQYASYLEMKDDTTKTKFGGADPRNYLEEDTNNVILFAGYGFSKEYRQARGHYYAVEDVINTARTNDDSPATCWTCKSPDVPRMMNEMGVEQFYASKFGDLKSEITHPIGCGDCHDPKTMNLTITRPALREALERQGVDMAEVSHQEMRTLVCAQCHVEYYFKGDGKYLTFPWDKGTNVESMEEYYDEADFADWTHAVSKTRMVKMQHPDYEIYASGIHAYRGVSCADCHMPYRTEGGVKYTNHHVQSPLLDIDNSCAVCHRWSEDEIRGRVEGIQTKVREGRDRAEAAVVRAHFDIAACMQAGANDDELAEVRGLVRSAQLRWDYVAANNGMGFHSPQECTRILMAAVDIAQEARIKARAILGKYGYDAVNYPDFSTEEKAKAVIAAFAEGNPPSLLGTEATAALK